MHPDIETIRNALYRGQISAAKVDAQRAFERVCARLNHYQEHDRDMAALDAWAKKFHGRHYVDNALDGSSAECVLEGYTIVGKPTQRYAFKRDTPDAARRLAVMAMNRGEIPC